MRLSLGGRIGPFHASSGIGCGGIPVLLGALLVAGIALPTVVGMLVPLILAAAFLREDAPRSHRTVTVALLTLWSWAYLPLAYEFFWHRGGILQVGVITHGVISLFISGAFVWLLASRTPQGLSSPDPAEPHPAVNAPERHWCPKHPHRDAQFHCTGCGSWNCAHCTVPFPGEGAMCEPCALAARFRDA